MFKHFRRIKMRGLWSMYLRFPFADIGKGLLGIIIGGFFIWGLSDSDIMIFGGGQAGPLMILPILVAIFGLYELGIGLVKLYKTILLFYKDSRRYSSR